MKILYESNWFQNYLKLLCETNEERSKNVGMTEFYMPMKAIYSHVSDFAIVPRPSLQWLEQSASLSVLKGLRDYAHNHVLLMGSPGIGKSTVLRQLLQEEAQQGDHIPVLIELRYLFSMSLPDRIFQRLHQIDPDLQLQREDFDTDLRRGKFLVLLDGLNELPAESRSAVEQFIQDHPRCAIVATTRDSLLNGTFRIHHTLAMLPLDNEQIEQFVRTYFCNFPGVAGAMLQQLNTLRRRRPFCQGRLEQTPLLLRMLCDEFRHNRTVSEDLGTLFRKFTESCVMNAAPFAQDGSREWWQRLLPQLAGEMMHPEQFFVIDKKAAQETFEAFFKACDVQHPGDKAFQCLQDLLKYSNNLLKHANEPGKIEFLHPLVQEYYAAEALLARLSDLTDDQLQQNYLNYLKWTEPLAVMLALVESQDQAMRIVELALHVDLALGIRLATVVRLEFRHQALARVDAKINAKEMPDWLKNASSPQSHTSLEQCTGLEIDHPYLRESAIAIFGNLDSERTIPTLLQGLEVEDPEHRGIAAYTLRELDNQQAIQVVPGLLRHLTHEDYGVRGSAAYVLGKFGSGPMAEPVISALFTTLKDDPDTYARGSAAEALGEIGSESAIPALLAALTHKNFWTRRCAANALGKFPGDCTAPILPQIMPLILTRVGKEAFRALTAIQAKCKFYNYEIYNYEIIQRQPPPSSSSSTDLLTRIDQTTQDINKRTKKMQEQSGNVSINISGGNFPGINNFTPNQGSQSYAKIDTQNNFFDTDKTLAQDITDLKEFIADLETKHPHLQTPAEADAVIETEIIKVQSDNPTRWHILRHQMSLLKRQLLDPERHLQATKATLIEVVKGVSEKSLIVKAIITYLDKLSEEPPR